MKIRHLAPAFISALIVSASLSGCLMSQPEESSPEYIAFQDAALHLPKSPGHKDEVLEIFPVTAATFITAAKDGELLFWSGNPLSPKILYSHGSPIDQAAVNWDKRIAAVSSKNGITIVDLSTHQKRFFTDRLRSRVLDLDLAPDGRSLLIASSDNHPYRWRFLDEKTAHTIPEREKSFERYNGPALPVSVALFHPDGRLFFTGDWDGSLNGWLTYDSDRQRGVYDENLFGPRFFSEGATRVRFNRGEDHEAIQEMNISSDGKLLLLGLKTGMLELWKVRGAKKGAELKGHDGEVFSVAFSPQGDHAITVGRDGYVRLLSVHEFTQEELKQKTDRKFDFALQIEREAAIANVRKAAFLTANQIVAGDSSGAVLLINTSSMPLATTPEKSESENP